MDVTYALYELRDGLHKTEEMKMYIEAVQNVENDVQLQILFGEFEKCKELSQYCNDEECKKHMQRAQQIKVKIFENEHYTALKKAERIINELRQTIAQQLFTVIDEQFVIDGVMKSKGGCQCGS